MSKQLPTHNDHSSIAAKQSMAQLWYVSVFSLVVLGLLSGPIPCRCQTPPKTAFEENDMLCLNETKGQLKDQYESLFTWWFGNSSQGFICNFVGVQCWHNDDGKVLSLRLPDMSLEGGFPEGIKYCGSMTTLDLSGNNLSGSIPKDLCKWLPYLVYIDLSSNQFTGSIPNELYDCAYLNLLRLNDNRLSGSIPRKLARLERLKDFNFANNMLSGQIPSKWRDNSTDLFANNAGLCGDPLAKSCAKNKSFKLGGLCGKSCMGNSATFIGGFLAGMFGVCLLGLGLWWWLRFAKRIKGPKFIPFPEITKNEIYSL